MEARIAPKPYDYALAASESLPKLYARATTLKDEVYRAWMDRLAVFFRDPDLAKQTEARRRIEYIDRYLLQREPRKPMQPEKKVRK